ncbi:hypothetical protein [Sulfurimonas sp.]
MKNIALIALLFMSSLSADALSKVSPPLKFQKNSEDYGFFLALSSSFPTPSVILQDLYWSKKCTTDGLSFMEFAKEESTKEDYGELLTYASQNNSSLYRKKIDALRSSSCIAKNR